MPCNLRLLKCYEVQLCLRSSLSSCAKLHSEQ